MLRKNPKDRDEAVQLLTEYLNLSDEALDIAEGYELLPDGAKRHIRLVINDFIASNIPALRRLYEAASHPDQVRFNRIIEEAQAERRNRGH